MINEQEGSRKCQAKAGNYLQKSVPDELQSQYTGKSNCKSSYYDLKEKNISKQASRNISKGGYNYRIQRGPLNKRSLKRPQYFAFLRQTIACIQVIDGIISEARAPYASGIKYHCCYNKATQTYYCRR
jgi:hypothetical protein